MTDSDYTKGTVRKPSKYKRDMTKFSNRDALSKEERAILESMNPKVFILDGIPYTEEELIHSFLNTFQRNQREMDASPDKAFYDSVRVAAGGKRIKDVTFDEDESVESVQDEYALTDTQHHYYQNTAVGKGTGEIVEIDWSENNYSPNQVFTNEQIDFLASQDKTFVGGTIANEINLKGLQLALNQYEIEYLQGVDCVVDTGKAVVADLEPEIKNQVFSAELINKVNKEREWTGGIIVPETDFSEDDEFDGHDDRNVVFRV